MTDTVYALATPSGRSGVAVIRVSGPAAEKSLCGLLGKKENPLRPREAVLRLLKNPETGHIIDHALVLYFRAPASFTGEDVVEYHLHGSSAVIKEMLSFLGAQADHRLADPGEFTRRAFENGKMDLTEAEAVADLIDAETQLQKQQALRQMGGALSGLYDDWRTKLSETLAHIEADLEFPDENLPEGLTPQLIPVINDLRNGIEDHLYDNRRGERLRDGLQVAVIGAPNAGKSSLVNALAKRDVAIVSAHEGTTRDVIDVPMDIGGYPVILSDTAGLRPDQIGQEGQEGIESEGIRRALKKAEESDIRLLVMDATFLPDLHKHTLNLSDERAIFVLNKCDDYKGDIPEIYGQKPVCISATTGAGLDDLVQAVVARLDKIIGTREAPSLTRQRHRKALEECSAALARSLEAPLPELMAEDLRLAIRDLGRITGRVDVEEILDIIFKDFCIGK